MRIWFDISNSPHVILFDELIKDLKRNGHEIIITTRPLANTIDLLDQRNILYQIIGKHYGKNIFMKIIGFPIRVLQLLYFLYNKKIDIAIGQSSFHLPLVARLLNIYSIYTNDNEHAAGNYIAFFCANKIIIPENFKLNNYLNIDVIKSKIAYYPGVKEGIYLWFKYENISLIRNHLDASVVNIYIRPEPQTAQYYTGALFFLDDIIKELQVVYNVTILTRNKEQYNHYKATDFNLCTVPEKPIDLDEIASNCTLFVGAGGSMTREFALLGIPTISVYQDDLLAVDRLLIQNNMMYHFPALKIEHIESVLELTNKPYVANDILVMGHKAYQLLKESIVSFNMN